MVEGSFGFSLPEIRCVVLGVALVTDERDTVKPLNKRQFDFSSVLIVLPKMK